MTAAPHLLLVALLLLAAAPAPSAADKFVVGDKQQWAQGVNYTSWPGRYHFHVGDWLVFNYEKGRYSVLQVNETAYASCDETNPIVSYNRGRNFAFQLNHTGRYFFISGGGYCYNGMKVSLLVEPTPPPPAMAPSASAASSTRGVWWTLTAAVGAAVLGLPLAV